MNATSDFDRLVASWLETDGPSDVRDSVVDAALATARATSRRTGLAASVAGPRSWPATGLRIGRAPWRLVVAVGLVLVALLLAIVFVGGSRPPVPLQAGVLAIADDAGLSIAGFDGGDRRPILAEGPAFDPRWSPDGASIAVLIGGGRLQTLVIVRPDGAVVGRSAAVKEYRWLGALVLVRRDDNRIDVLQPDLVPEHGQLPIDVIAGQDPGSPLSDQPLADILAVHRDHASGAINGWGGSPQDLGLITFVTFRPGHGSGGAGVATGGTDVRAMTWSPAEDRLAFVDTTCSVETPSAACSGTLTLVDSRGAGRLALAGSISAASEPVWDAAGRRLLAATVAGGQTDILLVDTDPIGLTRLTRDPAAETAPRWAPDGGRVLFLGERPTASGTVHDAWTVRTDGSDAIRVAADVNGADWRPAP